MYFSIYSGILLYSWRNRKSYYWLDPVSASTFFVQILLLSEPQTNFIPSPLCIIGTSFITSNILHIHWSLNMMMSQWCHQSHDPSFQPSNHRSSIFEQSNSGLLNLLLTSLWSLQNHCERLLLEVVSGWFVFNLRINMGLL